SAGTHVANAVAQEARIYLFCGQNEALVRANPSSSPPAGWTPCSRRLTRCESRTSAAPTLIRTENNGLIHEQREQQFQVLIHLGSGMDAVDGPAERPLRGREASFLQAPHLLQKRA